MKNKEQEIRKAMRALLSGHMYQGSFTHVELGKLYVGSHVMFEDRGDNLNATFPNTRDHTIGLFNAAMKEVKSKKRVFADNDQDSKAIEVMNKALEYISAFKNVLYMTLGIKVREVRENTYQELEEDKEWYLVHAGDSYLNIFEKPAEYIINKKSGYVCMN